MKYVRFLLIGILFLNIAVNFPFTAVGADSQRLNFKKHVAPILEKHCLECHNANDPQGDLSFETKAVAFKGGESGDVINAGHPNESLLIEYISGAEPEMPKKGKPLSKKEIGLLRKWIKQGADWPEKIVLIEPHLKKSDWWSFQPLKKYPLPELNQKNQQKVITPIDSFLLHRLEKEKLTYTKKADKRTLIRRLYFDLIGLPPSLKEVEDFVSNKNPEAYKNLIEKLLASERYGERWARHWLDTVHYADTHGYDKDKLRLNAWPYRDYVIRAFNQDKKYSDFVIDQIAGDVIRPGDSTGVAATGFIVTGPFDFVGQIEINEDLIDKKITRNLDRDDMVSVAINTFQSVTVQCARCHNHKFDPITQEDYYQQQAVFAAIDRSNRLYDPDPEVSKKRYTWTHSKKKLEQVVENIQQKINQKSGGKLSRLDQEIQELKPGKMKQTVAFGYHSQAENSDKNIKWVQLDLGQPTQVAEVVLVPAYDDYNQIGKGFGFPVRYRVEASNDSQFKAGVKVLLNRSDKNVKNPGLLEVHIPVTGESYRYFRMTAVKLAPRNHDYIFAMGEIKLINSDGKNIARRAKVTSLDSIESPPRWKRTNIVDGLFYSYESSETKHRLAKIEKERDSLYEKLVTSEEKKNLAHTETELAELNSQLESLPPQQTIYTAVTHFKPQGNFKPTNGVPRPIYLLHRGSEASPMKKVGPSGLDLIDGLSSNFQLKKSHSEGERRLALANWLVDKDNALTWRSIVNRIWQFHFGQGIVPTPNDFGRMGALPSHPELLDYLALNFRDNGQSIKDLHRMILLSAAYQQGSTSNTKAAAIDGGNQFLWRMNRRKLDAESIRDTVLQVSGKLDFKMYGPGYHLFKLEKPQNSPHYLYEKYDPNDVNSHRRSVYRFVVRSVPDPFMDSLDCANPSQLVPQRMQTLTALQALSLLNDKFMISMSSHLADRLEKESDSLEGQLKIACQLAYGRSPSSEELEILMKISKKHGLKNGCRLLFNTNEFMFID